MGLRRGGTVTEEVLGVVDIGGVGSEAVGAWIEVEDII